MAVLAVGLLALIIWMRLSADATIRRIVRVERLVTDALDRIGTPATPDSGDRSDLASLAVASARDQRELTAREFEQLADEVARANASLRGQSTELTRATDRDVALLDLVREVSADVHRTPGWTAEIARAYDRLVSHDHPMPELGGWAVSPTTMLWLLDHVATAAPTEILECGSGSSTIWLASALEHTGGSGRVTALESSAHYAEVTSAELDRLGLGHRATVVHAPLIETALPDGETRLWFDRSALDIQRPVDLLLVDGPVGSTGPEARYPAFPLLASMLAPGATVVLDDTHRPSEAATSERWTTETHDDRRLDQVRMVDRSTVFVVIR